MPRIDFRLAVEWKERKRILKVGFPLNLSRARATFEIPYGALERPADGKEAVGQKWVDLSAPDYGISLLNDSKYGFDVNGNTIRLTALRGSTDPDPKADEGHHEFSYALYPHEVDWKGGGTVRRGYEFNTPVIVARTGQHGGRLPASLSFFQLDSPGFVLTAVKRSEDGAGIILRGYETAGRAGDGTLRCWISMKEIGEADMLERPRQGAVRIAAGGKTARLVFGANEIKTWRILLNQ